MDDSVSTKGGMTKAGVQVIQEGTPMLFDQLYAATKAKHELVKRKVTPIK